MLIAQAPEEAGIADTHEVAVGTTGGTAAHSVL